MAPLFLQHSLSHLPESIFSLLSVYRAPVYRGSKIEKKIFCFAQHLFYFPLLISDFIFIFFIYFCYCTPSVILSLSLLTLFSLFLTVDFCVRYKGLYSGVDSFRLSFYGLQRKRQKKVRRLFRIAFALSCLVSSLLSFFLFPKKYRRAVMWFCCSELVRTKSNAATTTTILS